MATRMDAKISSSLMWIMEIACCMSPPIGSFQSKVILKRILMITTSIKVAEGKNKKHNLYSLGCTKFLHRVCIEFVQNMAIEKGYKHYEQEEQDI